MRHRRDIDGLRAVAVIPVVLFHAGVPQVSGGFLGVDIFFVISGYLITSLILGDLREGRFSLLNFYERRIRRIFPALFAVLAACMVLAYALFIPGDLKDFERSLLAATFFVSNIYFYSHSGYFDAPPDTQPLLHTWSLSIEEQFYVVFPLVLLFGSQWDRRRWGWLIAAFFVASLVASIWITRIDPNAAFYLAPTRAWELMLGALLAAKVLPGVSSQSLREAIAFLGIALILYAFFSFDSSTSLPGPIAVIPCLGAALVIYAGEDEGNSLVSETLRLWPLVFVGLISYSLYLWHWPLLVFARYWNITPLTTWQVGVIVGASFVLAGFSYAYIEQPFRRRPIVVRREVLFVGAATAMSVAIAFAVATSNGVPGRFSPHVLEVVKEAGRKPDRPCRGQPQDTPCVVGAAVRPTYAVWGDSHALAMVPALTALAERYGKAIELFANPACLGLFGVDSPRRPGDCLARNKRAMESLESSPDIGTVILIGRYASYLKGHIAGEPRRASSPQDYTLSADNQTFDLPARSARLERFLDLTVERLIAAGKTVVLVYPVPEIGYSVPLAVGRALATGRDPSTLTLTFATFKQRQDVILQILDRAGTSAQIKRIYPHKKLCDDNGCLVYANGKALYRDDDHLSRAGAEFILSAFQPIFAPSGVPVAVGSTSGPRSVHQEAIGTK